MRLGVTTNEPTSSIRIFSLGGRKRAEWGSPRLSAAIIIPSLYLMAKTLVPVTIGCLIGFHHDRVNVQGYADTHWVC